MVFAYLGVLPVWERVTLDILFCAGVHSGSPGRPMAQVQSVAVGILKPQPVQKGAASDDAVGDVDSCEAGDLTML